jgi:hypothetical protein
MALTLHRAVNRVVEVLSRLVVRRDDERRVWIFDVLTRDGSQTLGARTDFMHPTLLVQPLDGTLHVSTGQLFDDHLHLGIALSQGLVQMRRADAGVLALVVRATGLDRLMLAHVAWQDAVLRPETLQKRVHLFRARQARFVEDVQPLPIRRRCFLLPAR